MIGQVVSMAGSPRFSGSDCPFLTNGVESWRQHPGYRRIARRNSL